MTLTDRDRRIVLALVPLLLIAAYWFLVLGPKRTQAADAGKELSKQEQRLQAARDRSARLSAAKTDFSDDYSELVRLGKAVPASLDMPSLMVQLDSAAKGTGIHFTRIATGDRSQTSQATPASGGSSSSSSSASGSQPASAAGGAKAQTGYGKAVENSNQTADTASQKSNADASASAGDTSTSTSARSGLPVGGGSGGPAQGGPGAAGAGPAGLDNVPLDLTFQGSFFDLANFFHRLKRFVRVFNQQVEVRGRLMTVEGLKFSSTPEIFPRLKAELSATVYLSPRTGGTTAGASPAGPAGAPSGGTPASSPAGPGTTPTATATPPTP